MIPSPQIIATTRLLVRVALRLTVVVLLLLCVLEVSQTFYRLMFDPARFSGPGPRPTALGSLWYAVKQSLWLVTGAGVVLAADLFALRLLVPWPAEGCPRCRHAGAEGTPRCTECGLHLTPEPDSPPTA